MVETTKPTFWDNLCDRLLTCCENFHIFLGAKLCTKCEKGVMIPVKTMAVTDAATGMVATITTDERTPLMCTRCDHVQQ